MKCQYSENCEHYIDGIKEQLCRNNYMNCLVYKERKHRIEDEIKFIDKNGCFIFEAEKGLLNILRGKNG